MIQFDISNDFVAIKYQGRSGPFLHGILYRASVNIIVMASGVLNKMSKQ
jgi:hypothetical protein